jgi:NitT/TauT family transport system permease protein/taurine transport system permease protein
LSKRFNIALFTFLAVMALWYIATTLTGLISPARFPTPSETWSAFLFTMTKGYAGGTLINHALYSIRLVFMGFAVAIITGVPLGLLMGWNKKAEAFINPIFLIIRPIPPLAWVPLAILWLGLGDAAKIMVIWFSAFVPSVINSYTGVKNIERSVIEASRMLGTPTWRFIREVLIPASSPMIFTGLRLSLQASWTTLVAAELVGALFGLGRLLNVGQQDIYPAMILIGMLAVAVCGFVTTYLLELVEKRALSWNLAAQKGGA